MKMLHTNIVLIEDGDTIKVVEQWFIEHTDVVVQNLNLETWTHVLNPGDLIIFDSEFAMFRFPAKVINAERNL